MTIEFEPSRDYYSKHGEMSIPGDYANLLEELPSDVSSLCRIVQGVLVHVFWAERYGLKLAEDRNKEPGIRHVEHMLNRLQEIEAGPLDVRRPLEKRLVGNCRNFSVLLCAILRHQGVPARARCGFGRYFKQGWYEDHWVCEYWHAGEGRWILVDAQLDDFQREALKISFDPLNVPRDQFLVGGKAWQMCRSREADPDSFGIFDMRGLWFVRGDMLRDLAALNKMELLPWDSWGLIDVTDEEVSSQDLALLDHVAAVTAEEVDYTETRKLYESDERLKVPEVITSYTQAGPLKVEVATEKIKGGL